MSFQPALNKEENVDLLTRLTFAASQERQFNAAVPGGLNTEFQRLHLGNFSREIPVETYLQKPEKLIPATQGFSTRLVNHTGTQCWYISALKLAASTSFIDKYSDLDIDRDIKNKIEQREINSEITKTELPQEVEEKISFLQKFLVETEDCPAESVIADDKKDCLSSWCDILNLIDLSDEENPQKLSQFLKSEKPDLEIFRIRLTVSMAIMDCDLVIASKIEKESSQCEKSIKKLRDQIPLLKKLHNDLFVLINLLRTGEDHTPIANGLKDSVLQCLISIKNRADLGNTQLDPWEFFGLIADVFGDGVAEEDIYTVNHHPENNVLWNLFEGQSVQLKDHLFAHIHRLQYNDDGQHYFINNPISLDGRGV